jgi:aspartate racemase
MKTIGMLGGMSWQSTMPYYDIVNRIVAERLGGYHSAKILLLSVDFAEIETLMRSGRWDDAGEALASAAATLERAGAELLVLCTNTLHRVAPRIEARLSIPFLHVVDATAEEIHRTGARRVGLLATRFTMEQDFYRERLAGHGIETLIPGEEDRAAVHRIIFEELVLGRVEERSRHEMRRISTGLAARGAQGVVLACTELAMVLAPTDVPFAVFDTTAIHARQAALRALDGP